MQSFKLYFLALFSPQAIWPSDGLSPEELSLHGQAWALPAQLALREEWIPQDSLAKLFKNPSRETANVCTVSFWSAQQSLLEHLDLEPQRGRAHGLPPCAPKVLEAVLLPCGTFWMGAVFPTTSTLLAHSTQLQQQFYQQYGSLLLSTPLMSFPWIPSICLNGGWPLVAAQCLGPALENMARARIKS